MKMKRIRFEIENFGPWEIDVAPTVYPPREDTELLCRAISRLEGGCIECNRDRMWLRRSLDGTFFSRLECFVI